WILSWTYRPRIGRFGSTGAARAQTRGRVARSTRSLAPRLATIATCSTATSKPLCLVGVIIPHLPVLARQGDDERVLSPSLLPAAEGRVRSGWRNVRAYP